MKIVLSPKKFLFTLIVTSCLLAPLFGMDVPRYRTFAKASPERTMFECIIDLIKDIDSDEMEIMNLINQNKQLVTATDPWGTTLLTVATTYGMLSAIKHIINIGTELGLDAATAVNHTSRGMTALSIAVTKNYTKTIQYLLTLNPSQETIRNAIQKTNNPEIAELLQSKLEKEKPSAQPEQPRYRPQTEQPWHQERPAPRPQQPVPQQPQPGLPDLRPGATARQVLGVPPTASVDDAKRAWRKLILIYHPDKFEENKAILAQRGITTKEQATAAFRKINEAWERLKP